jgi:hypothetical protein
MLTRRTVRGFANARTFVTVIHQAEIAYRELLGSNRVKLEPGLRLDLPVLHSIKIKCCSISQKDFI